MKTSILLYLICVVEGTPSHRLHGYVEGRAFNFTAAAIADVNEEYALDFDAEDLREHYAVRVGFVTLYLRMNDALGSYEDAIRCFAGGPNDRHGPRADAAWVIAERTLDHCMTVLNGKP